MEYGYELFSARVGIDAQHLMNPHLYRTGSAGVVLRTCKARTSGSRKVAVTWDWSERVSRRESTSSNPPRALLTQPALGGQFRARGHFATDDHPQDRGTLRSGGPQPFKQPDKVDLDRRSSVFVKSRRGLFWAAPVCVARRPPRRLETM